MPSRPTHISKIREKSKGWHRVKVPKKFIEERERIRRTSPIIPYPSAAYEICLEILGHSKVPYGEYVIVNGTIRVKTKEQFDRVQQRITYLALTTRYEN